MRCTGGRVRVVPGGLAGGWVGQNSPTTRARLPKGSPCGGGEKVPAMPRPRETKARAAHPGAGPDPPCRRW
jgi:hypothetical protein